MFGGIAFLLSGHVACGLHGDSLIVRVGSEVFDGAIAEPFVKPFDMTGRPMKGWITVALRGYKAVDDLARWTERGMAHARSLPPR